LKDLADGVLNLDEELALAAAHEAVAAGLDAFDAISNGLVAGMNRAGELYGERGTSSRNC
jgi:dimethylamine corrinoid protein